MVQEPLIPYEIEDTVEAQCVQDLGRRRWLKLGLWGALGGMGAATWYGMAPSVVPLYFNGRQAYAHYTHPAEVHRLVLAANQLVDKPYKWGGGHQVLFDNGFDCSGSISHVLYRAGLLKQASNSKAFARYGVPGPGRFVTVYVKPGQHVFMEVCGLRFDTSGSREGEGPRWRVPNRSRTGFQARHPVYL